MNLVLKRVNKKNLTFIFVFIFFALLPHIVFACDPNQGAFCGKSGETVNIENYINDLLKFSGPVFGGLAMLKIIYGGILYGTAAGNPQKISEAKSHILYAILGAGLVLAANAILVLFGASPL